MQNSVFTPQDRPLEGAPISRRDVLKILPITFAAATISQLLGCERKKGAPAQAEKPQPTFEELTQFLQAEFGGAVKEVKKMGPKTIIYLGDVHTVTNADKLIDRIQKIEEFFDLEIVGTEGIVDRPGSEKDIKAHEYIETVCRIDQKKILQIPGGNIGVSDPPQGSFDPLFFNAGFQAIGLESEELIRLVGLGASAEQIIDILMQMTEQGYYPVAKGDKTAAIILEYLQIQDALKDELLFPKLDLAKIKWKTDGMTILGEEDKALVGELAVQFSLWRDTRLNTPRNAVAVEKLTTVMQAHGFTRGAMTFGRAHGCKTTFDPTGLTIQEELTKRNVSYAFIDIE